MERVKYGEDIRFLLLKIGFPYEINDTDFFSDKGMDSILFVRLIIEIESRFNIEYPDEYLSLVKSGSIQKLSSIIDCVITKNNNDRNNILQP